MQTLVIGDVRDIRQETDVGSKNNQKIHQWSHGSVLHKLTYKAERLGMAKEPKEDRSAPPRGSSAWQAWQAEKHASYEADQRASKGIVGARAILVVID